VKHSVLGSAHTAVETFALIVVDSIVRNKLHRVVYRFVLAQGRQLVVRRVFISPNGCARRDNALGEAHPSGLIFMKRHADNRACCSVTGIGRYFSRHQNYAPIL
jgi:hypothetical protein